MNETALLSIIAGFISLGLAIFLFREGEEKDQPWLHRETLYWSGVWAAVAICLIFKLSAVQSGYVTLWPDDGSRTLISQYFVENHVFALEDHIWPSGPFLLTKIVAVLTGDVVSAIRIVASVFSVCLVLGVGVLCREIYTCSLAGWFACLVVAMLPMTTWLGTGAMSEVGAVTWMILAAAAFLAALRKNSVLLLTLAGVSAALSSAWRYEGWMFVAALIGFYLVLYLLNRNKKAEGPTQDRIFSSIGAVLLFFTSLSFSFLWMLDSLRVLGSPFGFFSDQTAMNTKGVEGSLFEKLTLLPSELAAQLGGLNPLLMIGLIVFIVYASKRKQARIFLILFLIYATVYLFMVTWKGVGVSIERYVYTIIPFVVILMGSVMLPLELSIVRKSRVLKGFSIAGLVCSGLIVLAFGRFGFMQIQRNHENEKGFRDDSFLAAALLQQAVRGGSGLIQLEGVQDRSILLWESGDAGVEHLQHVPLVSGRPALFRFHEGSNVEEVLSMEGLRYIFHFGKGGAELESFETILSSDSLTVYRVE